MEQKDTIQCTMCKKRFFEDGFKVTRLGRRLKTCLECNARQRERHEREKCEHGAARRSVCKTCNPEGYQRHRQAVKARGKPRCEHNRDRATCPHCDPYMHRRMRIKQFAYQHSKEPWPLEHVVKGTRRLYDTVVDKWLGRFAQGLADGDLSTEQHAAALAMLQPYEGPAPVKLSST